MPGSPVLRARPPAFEERYSLTLLGRINSIAAVLAWSAIPLGSLLGGLAIEWTQNVALIYGVIGLLVFLIAVSFSFTALGRAEHYLEKGAEATD